jgi:hypothetical protein
LVILCLLNPAYGLFCLSSLHRYSVYKWSLSYSDSTRFTFPTYMSAFTCLVQSSCEHEI